MVNTTERPYLPPIPAGLDDPKVQRYLQELEAALRKILLDLYIDLSQGNISLTTFSAAPDTTDVPENQPVLRIDAGNEAIYVNVDGSMKSVTLT